MNNWIDEALCKGMDSSIFFPSDEDKKQASLNLKIAVGICQRCPVLLECFMHSINNEEADGIWGGIPFRQRMKIQRRYGVPIDPSLATKALKDYGIKV